MKVLDKWIKQSIIMVTIILIGWLFFPNLNLIAKFKNWLEPKPVLIDNTPLIIKQIKTIALLNTAIFSQDVIIDTAINTPSKYSALNIPFTSVPFGATERKEIVLVIQGKVTAGIDLKNIPDSAIYANGDSVRINLPTSKVTDVFVNPSGVETFYESGTWRNDETKPLLIVAEKKLLNAAIKHQLILKASEKAKAVIESFLSASGFKKINVLMDK